ncbi:unnamed protein product [Caenorhabditis sp. 36 PRJEB53466]|nr:unnamed protein product [Caenorhabditis sp. 36 PRJEB53466]
MQVFRRHGSIIHVNVRVAFLNVFLLYAFFFITDEVIKMLGTTQRGLFCVDPSIHYPRKESTVKSHEHRIYNITLTVLAVFLVEAFRQFSRIPRSTLVYRAGKREIPRYLVTVLTFVGYCQVGYIMNELLVKFVKGCENLDPNRYVEEFTCAGNPEDVAESRKSFYSGHSTVTMYCAFWTILYLQARLKPALRNNVVVAFLQLLIMTGGLFICCSRISDNKHHWSDVITGIIVGMSLASIAAVWWGKLFKSEEIGEDLQDDKSAEANEKETV